MEMLHLHKIMSIKRVSVSLLSLLSRIIILELLYNKANYVYLWGLEVQKYHVCLFQYDFKKKPTHGM